MTKTWKLNLVHIWESQSQSNLSSDWRRKPDHLEVNRTGAVVAVHAKVRKNRILPPLHTSDGAVEYLGDRSTSTSICEVAHKRLPENWVVEHSCEKGAV